MRLICSCTFLISGALTLACSAQSINQDTSLSVSCLLQDNGRPIRPQIPTVYRFNLKNSTGIYYYDIKHAWHQDLPPAVVVKEFAFMPDYFQKPQKYIYWALTDAILGRPSDSNSDFNIDDRKAEALMLFYDRYRYNIQTGELQKISRGFTNWDRGSASKIAHYTQATSSWKCTEIGNLQ